MEGSWDHLGGPLGASWAHFGSHFPPPGRLQEVIFGLFCDVPALSLNMSCSRCWSFFCAIACPLLPSLLRGWRRRAYAKNLKFIYPAGHTADPT